ncbi:MAG: hypothetical protein J6K58_06855 [Lachnospiraceae bacterium]|nr:hypothetical protein [Lachnospiraceae bacterium]MBP3458911.1 hypothetical protein [Lachnospiraceae bacterium]
MKKERRKFIKENLDYKKIIIQSIRSLDNEQDKRFLIQIIVMINTHIRNGNH